MDQQQIDSTTHTAGSGAPDVRRPIRASNNGMIRHRRLLTTLGDLTAQEAAALQSAITANQVAGNFYELMTGTNGAG